MIAVMTPGRQARQTIFRRNNSDLLIADLTKVDVKEHQFVTHTRRSIKNAVLHIMSGKAVQRAFRGHLIDHGLTQQIIDKVITD